jgi:hypothetical protein
MADFGAQEQLLLRALREGDGPSERDRERVARRLEAELSVALGVGAVTVAAAAGTGMVATSAAAASTNAAVSTGAAMSTGSAASTGALSTSAAVSAGTAVSAGAAVSKGAALSTAWLTGFAAKWLVGAAVVGAGGWGATQWVQRERAGSQSSAALVTPGATSSAAPSVSSGVGSTRPTVSPVQADLPATPTEPASRRGTATVPLGSAPGLSRAATSNGSSRASNVAAPSVAAASAATTSTNRTNAADLETELAMIADAQRALSAHAPQEALAALERHARAYPRGVLSVERSALVAIATCQSGRSSEGAQKAAAFARSYPSSPLVTRVRKACGAADN